MNKYVLNVTESMFRKCLSSLYKPTFALFFIDMEPSRRT